MAASPQTMLITGGSRGIGAATAELAAAAGWHVAISYRSNAEAAERVVESCRRHGVHAVAYQCDVADESATIALFDQAEAELGGLGCLVNNAGILFAMSKVEDMETDRLRKVLEVNVVGAFVCAREAVRRMSTDRGGAGGTIINISSAAAYLGSPNEFVDYALSKGAIDTFTIGLAKEVAHAGIRVNAVRPGLIDTEIHADAGVPDRVDQLKANIPMKRGGTPAEVAELILYLAGDGSSYITGATINISGGR